MVEIGPERAVPEFISRRGDGAIWFLQIAKQFFWNCRDGVGMVGSDDNLQAGDGIFGPIVYGDVGRDGLAGLSIGDGDVEVEQGVFDGGRGVGGNVLADRVARGDGLCGWLGGLGGTGGKKQDQ